MTEQTLDARGKACPQPVVETRRLLADPTIKRLIIRLDNEAAAENVARAGRQLDCEVMLETVSQDEIRVVLHRETSDISAPPLAANRETPARGLAENVVALFSSDEFGHGDPRLGRSLMKVFVQTLFEVEPRPKTLIFLNGGAKMTCEGSELLEPIQDFEKRGAKVLTCGTCLEFFDLKTSLQVGSVSNMFEIASLLVSADKIVRP